jgi:hypothetical protein
MFRLVTMMLLGIPHVGIPLFSQSISLKIGKNKNNFYLQKLIYIDSYLVKF